MILENVQNCKTLLAKGIFDAKFSSLLIDEYYSIITIELPNMTKFGFNDNDKCFEIEDTVDSDILNHIYQANYKLLMALYRDPNLKNQLLNVAPDEYRKFYIYMKAILSFNNIQANITGESPVTLSSMTFTVLDYGNIYRVNLF